MTMHKSLPTLLLGHTLQNRYSILKKLGAGGYGAVYLAEDTRLRGRNVAIKELSSPSPAARKLFKQEAAVLASISHPGLVRVSDFFGEGRSYYLVMDYIDGRDLLEIAIEAEEAQRMLPVDKVNAWMLQICEAVAYLHVQEPPIIHRDIKPNNIRLNTRGRAILVDFGIAKIDPQAKTQMMAKAVSQGFSPPEQYVSGERTGMRSDVYALGATMYCLLTVTPPPDSFERLIFGSKLVSPRRLNRDVSKDVEAVVLTAMSLERKKRYADANEILVALQKAVQRPVKPLSKAAKKKSPAVKASTAVATEEEETKTGPLCPRCTTQARPGARYCAYCGMDLRDRRVCPQCGRSNRPDARFCAHCRARLPVSTDF